jgi:hypothetical protein
VFGDALYFTLLSDTKPAGLGNTAATARTGCPIGISNNPGRPLITDPADGKLPPLTPAGAKAPRGLPIRRGCGLGAEDDPPGSLCALRLPGSVRGIHERLPHHPVAAGGGHPDGEDPRRPIIPLDGRPHVSPAIHQYLGDSRGRWEGDTLVVETTNFHPNGNPMGGYSVLSDQNLHSDRTLPPDGRRHDRVLVHVDNPTMWTRQWSATINWKRSRGEQLEYACHEGNYSLRGMLSAARAEEAGKR